MGGFVQANKILAGQRPASKRVPLNQNVLSSAMQAPTHFMFGPGKFLENAGVREWAVLDVIQDGAIIVVF